MVLLKHRTHKELDEELATLVERFLDLGDSDELQEIMEKLGRGMEDNGIGRISSRGYDIAENRVFHLGRDNWPTVVYTKDWKTGRTVIDGKRIRVYLKRYGSYWVTKEQMKEWGETPEGLLHVPDFAK